MKYPKPRLFRPTNPQKYSGDPKNIVARSNLEKRYFKIMDLNNQIVSWSSEEFFIPYVSPLDKRPHRYFVDLIYKVKDNNGKETVFVAEIKPYSQTFEPKIGKKKKMTIIREVTTWKVNEAKWEAAKNFCKKKGYVWQILTEKELKNSWD